jgi:hypothetical protein
MIPRRAALLLPAVAAACGAPVPVLEGPAIGYAYLPPIILDVAEIVMDERTPSGGPTDIGRELQLSPAEAVRVMGRDRLQAGGRENRARFIVVRAEILRVRQPSRGFLGGDAGERLDCRLAARLEIEGPNQQRLGYAEAQTARTRTIESSQQGRRIVAESLLRQAMFDLNTEFEFQVRRALRPYLMEGGGPAAPPAPVERQELPRT